MPKLQNDLQSRIDAPRTWQPDAVNIIDVSPCHCRNRGDMLFFQLPDFEIGADENGKLRGGFWCSTCGFSNAGSFDAKGDENEK